MITILKKCEEQCSRPLNKEERISEETKKLLKMRIHIKNSTDATDIEKRAADVACRNSLKMDLQNHREKKLLKTVEARRSIKKCRRNLIQERQVFTALKNEAGACVSLVRELWVVDEEEGQCS
ncbi:hypothetical protein OESDEN_02376 [Oesophagostomum dentatum]|uniref:Uncharacterized protein n=1 Tax=Oesophagostomum dentatum TaxID=61180 RepID=A0A0B1TNL8_OESDE|nr:hypothetical protein OESDEN_02376 [Oesophagostomum dentatum]